MPIKNVFDKDSVYRTAKNSIAQVVLWDSKSPKPSAGGGEPGSNSISGILNSKIVLRMNAQWDTIMSLSSGLSSLQTFLGAAGVSVLRSGIFTRKFFKGGGYLELQPEFRIVDWDGTGNVISSAKWLLSKCVPQSRGGVSEGIGSILDKINKNKAGGNETKSDFAKKVQGWAENLGDTIDSSVGGNPSTVHVKLSNYFDSQLMGNVTMIIQNVTVTFSSEITESGPLYGDFSVLLSSREQLISDHLRKSVIERSRITIV